MPNDDAALHHVFKLLFQAHPWHGVSSGETAPTEVRAFIEIVPTDPVKYELDKTRDTCVLIVPSDFPRCVRLFTVSFRKPSVARR
jgi:hypothetical protein